MALMKIKREVKLTPVKKMPSAKEMAPKVTIKVKEPKTPKLVTDKAVKPAKNYDNSAHERKEVKHFKKMGQHIDKIQTSLDKLKEMHNGD